MKIAVVSTMAAASWGGSEELWAAMVDEALAARHDVLLSIYRWFQVPPRISQLQAKGANIAWRSRSRLLKIDSIISKLVSRPVRIPLPIIASPFQKLATFQPDILCLNEGVIYSFVAINGLAAWLKKSQIPYIVLCHLNIDNFVPSDTLRDAARKFYGGAQQVCFVSQHNLQLAERQLATTFSNAMVIANYPPQIAKLSPIEFSTENDVSVLSLKMACVGRLDASHKGQDIVLEALSTTVWLARDWQLNIYGQGVNENYLRSLTVKYGIASRVNFCGYATDIEAVWRRNHILIAPSRYEGTPLALIEAMLCARPSVVTDVGGNTEWVSEPQTGFVAEAATVKSFGAALERAWQNRHGFAQMGLTARNMAAAKLDKNPGETFLNLLLASCRNEY